MKVVVIWYIRFQFANKFASSDENGWMCTVHSGSEEKKKTKSWLVDLIRMDREIKKTFYFQWLDFFFKPNFVKIGQVVRMLRVFVQF